MKKQKPKFLAEMGRYSFYQLDNKFNVKIDDIFFFEWKQAAESLVDLLKDLHLEQKSYEKYYEEASDKFKEYAETIEQLKSDKVYLENGEEE